MSDDNDLIRRGDVLRIFQPATTLVRIGICAEIRDLPAAPTFTAADLERAWEMGRDAAAREAFIACAETRHVTLARVAEDRASALTPPADLAQRVKE